MFERYIALVPAYEPTEILIDLLSQLQAADFEIIVVDDGSGPGYAPLFARAAFYATVLTHPQNRGKGAALKTGFSYILNHFAKERIVVTVDADGQHRVTDALRLCRCANEAPDTLILGGRKLKDHVPLRSRIGNSVTRWVYRLSTGVKVHDTQTGLRACNTRLLPELLQISGERYEYEMNVLLGFAGKRIPMKEIGIATIYIDNNAASHFHALRDSFCVYMEIIIFSASSLIGFLIDYGMYSFLIMITANLWLSNIVARIISASVNYTLNRRFVFPSQKSILTSAFQYFGLAALILVGNTLVLSWLVNACGMHQMLAKIITEVLFFAVNFLVQRVVIFGKQRES